MSVIVQVPGYGWGWTLLGEWWEVRDLTLAETVRHEWGEACWTARILAMGEEADRYLREAAKHRVGCF